MRTRLPSGSMDAAIFKCIADGFNRSNLIALQSNLDTSVVSQRLRRLQELRKVYSRPATVAGRYAVVWFIGADPQNDPVTYVSPYPIIAGREFFTAALFGAPKAEMQAQGAV